MPRNAPLLLTKVTLREVLEFLDLTWVEQYAACASGTDAIAASPNAAKTIVDKNKDLRMCFSPQPPVSRRPPYALARGRGSEAASLDVTPQLRRRAWRSC